MRLPPTLALALAVWTSTSTLGFWYLWDYQTRAGESGSVPNQWPTTSAVIPDPTRATLVLLAHPHCVCTRASLEELLRLMTRCPGQLTAHVLFWRPKHFPAGWEQTALWWQAAAIPGVQVRADEDGLEASRFGAATSGHTLLFDSARQLRFRGGLTNARGHAGVSAGCQAIETLLGGAFPEHVETAVFGCPLACPQPFATDETSR